MTGTLVCPKGHASTEADYCSECGAKMQGAAIAGGARNTGGSVAAGQICPDCGTAREHDDTAFCEVCGYNFVTGAHGEVAPVTPSSPPPLSPPPPPPPPLIVEAAPADHAPVFPEPVVVAPANEVTPGAQRWSLLVSVDPSLRAAESPEAPQDTAPYSVSLDQPVSLIGRPNEARGIFPDVALPQDEAVSRRHALLQLDPQQGLLLRDIGAANGTRLNGKELDPMVDYPVKDGDEITLGHWSRLRVQAS